MEILLDSIQDIIWQLRTRIAQDAEKKRDFLMYDGGSFVFHTRIYLKALEMVRDQYLSDTLCVCSREVSLIYYGAKAYLGHSCFSPHPDYIMIERLGAARWVLENPSCVLYDHWLDYLYKECSNIGIDLVIEEQECLRGGLDITAVYNKACSKVLLELEVKEIKCELGIDITVQELEQCKLDFELSVKPLNCGIDLKTYIKAVNCGYDLSAIVGLINCGVDVFLSAVNTNSCVQGEDVLL